VLLSLRAVSALVLPLAAASAAALGLTHAVGHVLPAKLGVVILLYRWRRLTLVLVYLGCILL
jgi:hypothetical protein